MIPVPKAKKIMIEQVIQFHKVLKLSSLELVEQEDCHPFFWGGGQYFRSF